MFLQTQRFYDAIYGWKDYAAEAQRLKALLAGRQTSGRRTLLDIACGTGGHIPYLRDDFAYEGLDLDAKMLALARERFPDIPFHQGNLLDFDLGRQFDVVTCLFSSIAYVKTAQKLEQAIATMARHVRPGGVLVIEPFVAPQDWEAGRPTATFVDQPDLKIARMSVGAREGDVAIITFEYLVATSAGIERLSERHELGLFTDTQYRGAFTAAGCDVARDLDGLMGRSLYLGVRTTSPGPLSSTPRG
jgi:SAM-dependent methyltransferase